jgi:hypothetical protein
VPAPFKALAAWVSSRRLRARGVVISIITQTASYNDEENHYVIASRLVSLASSRFRHSPDSPSAPPADTPAKVRLPALGGTRRPPRFISANGINSNGLVVGSESDGKGNQFAVLWQNGTAIKLNSLPGVAASGWNLEDATAINDNSDPQIVGYGIAPGGGLPQAFLVNLNEAEATPPSPISLSPASGSFPAGVVGTPYTQTITASGGVGNSSLAITSGALPPGMTAIQKPNELVITGTPAASGTFTFTVTATDPADPASQTYTLTINPQLPPPPPPKPPTKLEAIEGLIFNGAGMALDVLLHRDTSGIQGNIAFDLPYAAPFGPLGL